MDLLASKARILPAVRLLGSSVDATLRRPSFLGTHKVGEYAIDLLEMDSNKVRYSP